MITFLFILKFIFSCRFPSLSKYHHFLIEKKSVSIHLLRRFDRTYKQLITVESRIHFLSLCVSHDLIPSFCNFRLPKSHVFSHSQVRRFQASLTRKELHCAHRKRHLLQTRLSQANSELSKDCSSFEILFLSHLVRRQLSNFKLQSLSRLNNKFSQLQSNSNKTPFPSITNLSSHNLSPEESSALQFGLKHSILPSKPNIIATKTLGELFFRRIRDPSLKDDIQHAFLSWFHHSKLVCASAQNRHLHSTLSNLKKNSSICILKADKGLGPVIMDRTDYDAKLQAIISDTSKFSLVSDTIDPHRFIKFENSLKYYINKHIKPYLSQDVIDFILPSGTQPARLYGLAKIHKPNCPLRPVVSSINTAQYNLAKVLHEMLSPVINSDLTVPSSSEFLSCLKKHSIDTSSRLLSLDVSSLFTNVPLVETINIAADLLYNSPNKPPFEKRHFKKLLHFATSCEFVFNGATYKQIDGVAMGSPLGPCFANLFLGHFEGSWLASSAQPVRFYRRYVDDIFCIVSDDFDSNAFLTHMNSRHPNIKFTVEKEVDGNIPFLDVSVTRDSSSVQTTVYRKPTFSNVLLNFQSTAPRSWKHGLILCLLKRGYNLSSSWSAFHSEVSFLRSLFKNNQYPLRFFNSRLSMFLNNLFSTHTTDNSSISQPKYFVIPYHGTASVTLAKRLRKMVEKTKSSIELSFSTCKVSSYFSNKEKIPGLLRSSVIYKFTCGAVPACAYIGRTSRHLLTRIREHASTRSAVSEHLSSCVTCNPADLSTNFKIIDSAHTSSELAIKEALHISANSPSLNVALANHGASVTLGIF